MISNHAVSPHNLEYQASARSRTLSDLPLMLITVLPLGIWFLPYILLNTRADLYRRWMFGEFGLIENLTVLFLIATVGVGIAFLLKTRQWALYPVRIWVLLLVLGCLFFAGEEISWGQHFFGWQSPETWQELNYQGETNLHNMRTVYLFNGTLGINFNKVFNLWPRLLLEVVIVFSAIVLPLILLWKGDRRNPRTSLLYWLFPTIVCLPTAVCISVLPLLKKTALWLYPSLLPFVKIHSGELKECLFAVFLLLYIGSLLTRYRHYTQTSET